MHRWLTVALASLAGFAAITAAAANTDRSVGLWRNPKNSVHVRSHPCGASMCGTVVWANDKAKADAARGGTATLVGSQLFRNFTRELEVGTRGLTGPAASRRLAAMARAHIAEVERQQAARSGGVVPDHTTTVDGRIGAAPEQVRPDGVILIAWHYLTEAVIRTVTYLEENGPERKGGWKASITTFVDDTAVPRTARLPAGATEEQSEDWINRYINSGVLLEAEAIDR